MTQNTQTTADRIYGLIISRFADNAAAHIAAEIDALILQRDEATAKAKELTLERDEARAQLQEARARVAEVEASCKRYNKLAEDRGAELAVWKCKHGLPENVLAQLDDARAELKSQSDAALVVSQTYQASLDRLDAELAKARAEAERLRPAAEAWAARISPGTIPVTMTRTN